MTKYLFFSIQNGFPFEQLMKPLDFANDSHGFSNWIMRFPLTIYSSDLHSKHVFEQDSVKSCSNYVNVVEEGWKYFVITKSDGSRLYCTSQVFYQKGTLSRIKNSNNSKQPERQQQSFYLPRCLVLMSGEPYFKLHVNLLKIYRQIQKQNPNISHITNLKLLSNYLKLKQEQRLSQFTFEPQKQGNKGQAQTILRYYIAKCNQLKSGEAMLVQKRTNLPIMHLYRLKSDKMLQFGHFFNIPLSKNTLTNALTAILLQKQLIVTSNNSNLNVMVIESLLQLIRPLKWEQHMLVHNLPHSLLEVIEESFMPFIVGVQKKFLAEVSTNDKFILFVDQDRLYMPSRLPNIGKIIDEFANSLSLPNTANYSNEKLILQHSIAFMCRLLEPIVKPKVPNTSSQFYSQFSHTSLYEGFVSRVNRLESSQLIDLLSFSDQKERMLEIQKELNKVNSYHQTPKIIYNETEWIEYYLSLRNPHQKEDKKEEETLKMPSLRQIKQNVVNQARQNKMIRRISTMRDKERSTSIHSPCLKRKIKVSGVKHDQGGPFLIELLEERLDTKLV